MSKNITPDHISWQHNAICDVDSQGYQQVFIKYYWFHKVLLLIYVKMKQLEGKSTVDHQYIYILQQFR